MVHYIVFIEDFFSMKIRFDCFIFLKSPSKVNKVKSYTIDVVAIMTSGVFIL